MNEQEKGMKEEKKPKRIPILTLFSHTGWKKIKST